MRDIFLVIVSPKEKGAAKKWMPTVCGKDVTVKDKVEFLIIYNLPVKIELTEYLEKKGTRNARDRINENK